MNRPPPIRDLFRGVRIGGQLYARNGKSNADPVKVKTHTTPSHAAEFIASLLGGPVDAELVMQGEKGNVYIPALEQQDGKVGFSHYAVELMASLCSEDLLTLARYVGPFLEQRSGAYQLRKVRCDKCGKVDRLHSVVGWHSHGPAELCDDCYTKFTGALAECESYCNLALDHEGLCSDRG